MLLLKYTAVKCVKEITAAAWTRFTAEPLVHQQLRLAQFHIHPFLAVF